MINFTVKRTTEISQTGKRGGASLNTGPLPHPVQGGWRLPCSSLTWGSWVRLGSLALLSLRQEGSETQAGNTLACSPWPHPKLAPRKGKQLIHWGGGLGGCPCSLPLG